MHHARLFVDSVFPVQVAAWDLRHYLALLREESLLAALSARLQSVTAHDFDVLALEPHKKDGGVFVRFTYSPAENALATIERQLKHEVAKHGGLPSWIGLRKPDIWLVKGSPWKEDLNRFASPILKVAFDGPDVQEQALYDLFRPYGRIRDLSQPTSGPAGSLRSTTITFQRLHSAAIARNVLHGLDFPTNPNSTTRLRTAYQQPIHPHLIRDWMSSHPKIVLPILVFLLGTLTYTIFDPIRSLMVKGKMLDWFDYREFEIYKWVRTNTLDRLSNFRSQASSHTEEVWKERKEAEVAMKAYLSDMPTTVAFVHGPQGTGKSGMLQTVLKDTRRKAIIIDCRELQKATSDTRLLAVLAEQTGYWPVFTFLNSINSLIDLASVGLIGQKAGLSSSLPDQLHQILDVVTMGLKGVSSSHRASVKRQLKLDAERDARKEHNEWRREQIKQGTWHDGRLDCVAGNGVMSELGLGDEMLGANDVSTVRVEGDSEKNGAKESAEEGERKRKTKEEVEAVGSLPIVVIRNYESRVGSNRDEVLGVLAGWAANLAENQIAHVIVLSDNRENAKRLAKALPSKALNSIALYDADATSALSFVKQKLKDADVDIEFTSSQTAYVGRLGGRASDLDSLIHKVRSGQGVEEAVEDIINRGVGELRKNAFGDDADDAKGLPWSREQAWAVLKLLAQKTEAPYHDVLVEFPFRGDEAPLRSMEHAELISIETKDGRPSTIRPGKPVFKWVFERLVNDPVFRATQDIAFNEKVIAKAETTIQACEQELLALRDIVGTESRYWWGGRKASGARMDYLFGKMRVAEGKVEALEKANKELKKVLATDV